MKKRTTLTIAALFCAAAASHAVDLYFDANGTDPGFGIDATNTFLVDPTLPTWTTDTNGISGHTAVSTNDVLHFGLEGSGGNLFNWENFEHLPVGGLHTYQKPNGTNATINRFQKKGGGTEILDWAPGAFFQTDQGCGLFWDFSTRGDLVKTGDAWLAFGDGKLKLDGTMTISNGFVVVRNLSTVDDGSNFHMIDGGLRFKGGLTGTANIGVLSGTGIVTKDSAGNLWNLDIQSTGIDTASDVATDAILFEQGASFGLDASAVSTMDITKISGTNHADLVRVMWGSQTLTQAGTLNVNLLPGSEPLADGDTFELFRVNTTENAVIQGGFTQINLPYAGAGLTFDVTSLSSSGTISVITGSTNAPAKPTGLLVVTSGVYTAELDWDDNPESNLGWYNVYRTQTSGTGYELIASGLTNSAYVDATPIPNDSTYHYAVSAYNLAAVESEISDETSAFFAFALGCGDFEQPEGSGPFDATGHWVQNGNNQGIVRATWAREDGEQGAQMKGWVTNVTHSFHQDAEGTPGMQYTLDAGFKYNNNFESNGGSVVMELICLDAAQQELAKATLDINSHLDAAEGWKHLDVSLAAPANTTTIRSWFYWTTDDNIEDLSQTSAFVDNVTLTQSGSLYEAWALSYGLTGEDAAQTNDYEPDGMDNLLEYALGGDPTAVDANEKLPAYSVAEDAGTNWFYYVHNERTDDDTLTYTLQRKGDLVNEPSWQTNGFEFINESAASNSVKSVTNRTSTTEDHKFINLLIEQN
jgi:hypothetical protein